MATVIAVPRSTDGLNLADLDEAAAADEIVRRMTARFPGVDFIPVPGGPLSGEWSRLVVGNYCVTLTAEEEEALRSVTESVLCDTDEFFFYRIEGSVS